MISLGLHGRKHLIQLRAGDTVYFRGGVYQTTVLDGTGMYEETNGTGR